MPRDLVITPSTVDRHFRHILLKLGVHGRAQAIALAFQQDLSEPPVSSSGRPFGSRSIGRLGDQGLAVGVAVGDGEGDALRGCVSCFA